MMEAMHGNRRLLARVLWGSVAAGVLACPGSVRADGVCLLGAGSNANEATYAYLFPNWGKAQVTRFDVWLCDTEVCSFPDSEETFTGLTVMNYGTAGASDIVGLYWQSGGGACKADTGLIPMTYAGIWASGFPAWTWNGLSVDLAKCAVDPDFSVPLRIYADIASCPAQGAGVTLGIPAGGLTDNHAGCSAPYEGVMDARPKAITYVAKERDRETAAPADLVTYTIWYGLPGTLPLSAITVVDSLPDYTHWNGVSFPPPDPGAPPGILRWTVPGPLNPAGGRTGQIRFQVSVDWGNMDWFEPGSGNLAAPEGARIGNLARVSYAGSNCAADSFLTDPRFFVVRRYQMWMLGNNDVLFASRPGITDDEVIYEINVRNESYLREWQNVNLWDTVPGELDVWCSSCGFEDPFIGWTMTPTPAAPYSPGRIVAGGNTMLTWKLDLGPARTALIRWKARVSPQAPQDSTAINTVSMRAFGRPATVGGSGDSMRPRTFTHLARIVLRTTYVSYLAWGGSDTAQAGFFITFYPLHQAASFELRGLEMQVTDPYTATGGVSQSITRYLGNCWDGFGNCAALGIGLTGGCRAERRPAYYADWRSPNCRMCDPETVNAPAEPAHFLYKLVANSPVLWSLYSAIRNTPQDQQAFTPSTSLTFSGFIHYTFRRMPVSLAEMDDGDSLNIINTSINATGDLDPDLPTTVFMFIWDDVSQAWNYFRMVDLDKESQYATSPASFYEPCGHYRIVSSDARLVIRQSCTAWGVCTGLANSSATLSPTRERGTLVSRYAGDAFYVFPTSLYGTMGDGSQASVAIGNLGANAVNFRIERYVPRDIFNGGACVPLWMADTSGRWEFAYRGSVAPGFNNPENPKIYGTDYDASFFFRTADQNGGIWRVVQETDGSLQVAAGSQIWTAYSGGNMLHDKGGTMTGNEFWAFTGANWNQACNAPHGAFDWIEVFCPKRNTQVTADTSDGYNSTHTTDGSDQCVSFGAFTDVAPGQKRIMRVIGDQSNLVAMHNQCVGNHKYLTAPFVAMGVHYEIITPPYVFIGQQFWLTVVVVSTAGGTESDYCGTTGFTSTDPNAELMGVDLGLYAYTWTSDSPECASPVPDNGVKLLLGVSFQEMGMQVINAFDIEDGSITGLGGVRVVGVDVKLSKEPLSGVAASGEIVQFKICWSNYSSASASEFVITDRIPSGVKFATMPVQPSADLFCGATYGLTDASVAYSATDDAPGAFQPVPASGTANNVTWLRWTIPQIGIATTGCVCFKVAVD